MQALMIPLMAFLSRMDGGGFFAPRLAAMGLKFLPALLFAACVALPFFHHPLTALVVLAFSYFAKNTGHGVVLGWGSANPQARGRRQFLSPLVDLIANKLKIVDTDVNGDATIAYCRLFMAVKGFFIGLPLFPLGVLMAVFQPLAYELGNRRLKIKGVEPAVISEMLSGAFMGLIVAVSL